MIDDTNSFNSPSTPDVDALVDDPRVAEVVDAYLRELEAGNTPDRQKYLAQYPELSQTITQCLQGLELVRIGKNASRSRSSFAAETDESSLAGGRLAEPLGDFQLLRQIARGGMGVVYEAIQRSLGRRVAVKVLPFAATFDPRQLQRFKLEAQTAALLHHTHIVPIFAVGCERGVHFYAMQLIDGQSLAVVIRQFRQKAGKTGEVHPSSDRQVRSARLDQTANWQPGETRSSSDNPALTDTDCMRFDVSAAMTAGASIQSETYIQRVARLIIQAADALEHAHQGGVIHRDIKPANLLVDTTGNLWITDFGLAQLQSDQGLTHTGDFLGTFRYMSPEQAGGLRGILDHRTDIYSLGATFYELLALEPVFTGQTHQELLYKILHEDPQKIRQWNHSVSPELETIILKALSKTSADRYRSAADFRDDIQRYLDHQPILARRPTLVDRLRKWSRRHPSVIVAGFLLLLVIAAASLIANRLISQEQHRTADALDREKLRAAESELRFQQAKQAVDALFQISEEELADKPTEFARKRILEVVLSHYQELIEQRAGHPDSQAELALEQSKVREILRELNLIQREMHLRLLDNSAVQQELRLTPDQQTKMTAMIKDWTAEREGRFDEFHAMGEAERRKEITISAEKHERALSELLTTDQLKRFKQISTQVQGFFAFKEPEIVRALTLTSDQRSKIRDIERTIFVRRFVPGPGMGPPPRHASFVREHEQALAQVLAILTPEQLNEWQLLSGEPFTASIEDWMHGPFRMPPPSTNHR
jgi:eukaryotic-like serine/threonine-protein kinase